MLKKIKMLIFAVCSLFLLLSINVSAQTTSTESVTESIRQVQQYNFAIGILAMLLVGFGFLMVFIKQYGYRLTSVSFGVVRCCTVLYGVVRKYNTALRTVPCSVVQSEKSE